MYLELKTADGELECLPYARIHKVGRGDPVVPVPAREGLDYVLNRIAEDKCVGISHPDVGFFNKPFCRLRWVQGEPPKNKNEKK